MNTRPLASLSDAELVDCCRAGNADAWEVLVVRMSPLAYGIARRARLGPDAAADVLQEVFERLVENLDRITDPARLSAWIATTARRAALRIAYAEARTISGTAADDRLELLESADPLPGQALERMEAWHAVRSAVDQLDPRCAALLRRLYYGPQRASYDDLALEFGMARGSLGPTRGRCLEKLRRLMQDQDDSTS